MIECKELKHLKYINFHYNVIMQLKQFFEEHTHIQCIAKSPSLQRSSRKVSTKNLLKSNNIEIKINCISCT